MRVDLTLRILADHFVVGRKHAKSLALPFSSEAGSQASEKGGGYDPNKWSTQRRKPCNDGNPNEKSIGPQMGVVFFFPWKSKVPVKRVFYHFSGFFHGCKTLFTGTFFEIFTPSPDFSRGLFGIFSRVRFKISRAQNQFFSREGYIFHGQNFRKEIKKAKNYNFDTHKYKESVQKKVL